MADVDLGLAKIQRQILQFHSESYCKLMSCKEHMEREQDDLTRLKLDWAEFQSKIQVDIR